MTIAATYREAASGAELPLLVTPPIEPLTLALFAGGSGDHNPIHLDRQFAAANGFDDVFAHGMLSMAYLGRLLSNWAPPERIREFTTRFISITPLRSVVMCSGTVAEIVTEGGLRLARLKLKTTLSDGTVTLTGEGLVQLD
ncbi:MaoC/PaaZ C-terminal domain-containing protein [Terricaulis silvestris]|uniref:(3R)-hydroxyacyl-ACP dehydratase subunit HadB n=1 Tax=Terricaulis silvestris TaxID=2686094 RepID=A0A6I6MS88_9CAUL|nr:MaoC/PaaZ C-terminal domain-containing protein [Terricaulis silvestris]QGZ96218.1 (3R)-hydroxyacyl-ACP dehydratase subunit HadB [Terricaulis silvestris]